MAKLRLRFARPDEVTDPKIRDAIVHSVKVGTPRAESQAMRARVPAVFWSFQNAWNDTFIDGVADHDTKELCRVYVSRSVECHYCGNQRSSKSAKQGIVEADYMELLNFEKSGRYDDKTKAALSLAEAITWDLNPDDAFWDRLYSHYSEEEIIEMGFFIGATMGQQRFNRLLNMHEHLGTTGFEALAATPAADAAE